MGKPWKRVGSQLNLWGSAQAYGAVGAVETCGGTAPAYGESRAGVWGLLAWMAPLVYGGGLLRMGG